MSRDFLSIRLLFDAYGITFGVMFSIMTTVWNPFGAGTERNGRRLKKIDTKTGTEALNREAVPVGVQQ